MEMKFTWFIQIYLCESKQFSIKEAILILICSENTWAFSLWWSERFDVEYAVTPTNSGISSNAFMIFHNEHIECENTNIFAASLNR